MRTPWFTYALACLIIFVPGIPQLFARCPAADPWGSRGHGANSIARALAPSRKFRCHPLNFRPARGRVEAPRSICSRVALRMVFGMWRRRCRCHCRLTVLSVKENPRSFTSVLASAPGFWWFCRPALGFWHVATPLSLPLPVTCRQYQWRAASIDRRGRRHGVSRECSMPVCRLCRIRRCARSVLSIIF